MNRTFPAKVEKLEEANEFFNSVADGAEAGMTGEWLGSMKDRMQFELALEELFVNVAHYAYPDSEGEVDLEFILSEDGRELTMVMSDSGIPFNPLERTEEDAMANLDDLTPGGMGIFMVQNYATELKYRYENGKNIVTFVRRAA